MAPETRPPEPGQRIGSRLGGLRTRADKEKALAGGKTSQEAPVVPAVAQRRPGDRRSTRRLGGHLTKVDKAAGKKQGRAFYKRRRKANGRPKGRQVPADKPAGSS